MLPFLIVLFRLVHVVAGALWVGAAVLYLFFIKPSVQAIGPAGPKFMQNLTQRQRYPMFMVSASVLTVISGVFLYSYASGSFNLAWLQTGPGLGFTIGSVAAMVAFFVGNFGLGPTAGKMGSIGQAIAANGGQPTTEQLNLLRGLETRMQQFELIDIVSLSVALVTMATARYWGFF